MIYLMTYDVQFWLSYVITVWMSVYGDDCHSLYLRADLMLFQIQWNYDSPAGLTWFIIGHGLAFQDVSDVFIFLHLNFHYIFIKKQ